MSKLAYKFYKVKRKSKNWLQDNKVFFETVVMIFLTIMSIVVAYNANRISEKANDLMEAELELSKLEKLPRFTIKNTQNKNEYCILNVGGTISDATADFEYYILIEVTKFNKRKTFAVKVIDAYDSSHCEYDYHNAMFSTKKNETDVYSSMELLGKELQKDGFSMEYRTIELLEIYYKDYSEKNCVEWFRVGGVWTPSITALSDDEFWEISSMYSTYIWNGEDILKENSSAISESLDRLLECIIVEFEEE